MVSYNGIIHGRQVRTINKVYRIRHFRDEMLLDINEYFQPAVRNELEALAQTIQNIIILRKGTIPNDPLCGVGIGDYLFEILDSRTISEIQLSIESQIDRYVINHNSTVTVNVSKYSDTPEGVNTLKVTVTLQAINDDNSRTELEFLFAGGRNTKKLVSKLITS